MEFRKLHVSLLFRVGLCFLTATCPPLLFAQSEENSAPFGGKSLSSVRATVSTTSPEAAALALSRSKRIQATASFTQGQFLESEGKKEEALAYYEKASLDDPDFLPSSIRKAYILLQLDRADESIKVLQSISPRDPQNAEVMCLMAFAYIQKGQREDALKFADAAYAAALADASREPEYYDRVAEMVGKLLIESGNTTPTNYSQKLLPLLERAEVENSRNLPLLSKIAELYALLSNHKKALEYYEKIYDIAPRFPQIREKMVMMLLAIGNEERAITILEEILERDPTQKKFYPVLGELYERARKWDKSEENYLMSLRVGNDTAQDYTAAALSLLRNKKPDKAISIMTEAELKYPDSPHVPYLKAIALRANKQFEESISSFDLAEKKGQILSNFLNSNFYFEYGSSFEQAKHYDAAERMFQKSLEKDPGNHVTMNYMAYMWAEQNRKLNEAEKLLKKALSLDPKNPAYQDSLGWTYYQMGNYEKAKEYLDLSLKQMSDDSVVNDHMGDVMFKLGNLAKAIEHWNKALPKSDERSRIEAKIKKGQETLSMRHP